MDNVKEQLVTVILSDGELSALFSLAGIKPENSSPLAKIAAQGTAPDAGNKLRQAGLLGRDNRPTDGCTEFLRILANPGTEIDLLWGNPDGYSISHVYSAAGSDRLVSYTKSGGSNNLSYFLSTQDITDLLVEKLANPPLREMADFSIEADSAVLPVFFALLDLYREAQLKAVLERRSELEVKTGADDINRILQEAKVENNLTWYAPAGFIAIPSDSAWTVPVISKGISDLKRQGIIEKDDVLSTRLTSFAYKAFPLASFFGIKIYARRNNFIERTHIGFFRSISNLLYTQIVSEGGQDRAIISSISTSQLPEILFNLATLPFEAGNQKPSVPAEPLRSDALVCGKCGTANAAGAKFCSKCGSSLATPSPKFCRKCGDPVKAGQKFCDKCGEKLE